MTARQLRRAQERKQRKLQIKNTRNASDSLNLTRSMPETLRSDDSNGKPSLGVVNTGLTGRSHLVAADDAAAYEQHVQAYERELRPVGLRECALVQSLADAHWRLERLAALEMAIYARGRIEFAQNFEQQEASLRPALIELETFLVYEKQLRNLHLQESRLRRQREKDAAELRALQKERDAREAEQYDVAAKMYVAARKDNKPFDPAEFGFEFSTEDVQRYLAGVRAAHIYRETLSQDLQQASLSASAAGSRTPASA